MALDYDPIVSIIIPIYNVEKYLKGCLDSVEEQTYQSIQVVMVNDGSTDSSGSIAREYALRNNKFHYFEKENGGLSSARNYGIDKAIGEYIYFLDSDDRISNNCIEEFIKSTEDGVDVIISKYILEDSILGKKYVPFELDKSEYVFKEEDKEVEILARHLNAYPGKGFIIKDTLMPVWKNLYRASLLKEHNITFVSERVYGAEDYIFNFEAYYWAHGIKITSFVSCIHLIVDNSLSRSYKSDFYMRDIERLKKVKELIKCKQFYNVRLIENAIECEACRNIVTTVNVFAKSRFENSAQELKYFFSIEEICGTLQRVSHPNLEYKYAFLYWIIRNLGWSLAFNILNHVNRYYKVYRYIEKMKRK